MARRRFLLPAALTLATFASITPSLLRADDAPPADTEVAKRNFLGTINSSNTYVLSAARGDAYPTMKLEKGDTVTVVGIRFNWLKILPPKGSFAYVPKVYIQRRGNGGVGRASREIIAKAGSLLNPMKIAPMGKIEENQDVTILGDEDEYFKIAPPEGSVLYVSKEFVDPVKALPKADAPAGPVAGTGNADEHAAPPIANGGVSAAPETQPAAIASNNGPSVAPTTKATQTTADVATEFDRLESQYAAASNKPVTEQPITELQTSYEGLVKQDALPPSMRRIAEVRIATLKLRGEAKQEFMAAKASEDQSKEREKAIVSERQEITDRIKQNTVTVYIAVGTLRASSLQRAGSVLYRLTDPVNGHTVAYVKSEDTKYAPLLGQFVGVRGNLTTDATVGMKMIESPTVIEPVDPAKVNDSVAAQLIPASMMPKGGQASTGGEQ